MDLFLPIDKRNNQYDNEQKRIRILTAKLHYVHWPRSHLIFVDFSNKKKRYLNRTSKLSIEFSFQKRLSANKIYLFNGFGIYFSNSLVYRIVGAHNFFCPEALSVARPLVRIIV